MKIGFITDIHEDIVSLEYALQLLTKENCEKIICLGDIVGFAIPFSRNISVRNADACVKTVKQHSAAVVIGNHDLYALRKIPEHNAGFDYGDNWYEQDYETRARLAKNKIWFYEDSEIPCVLSEESVSYLNELKEADVVNLENTAIFISHFCHPDYTGSSMHFPSEGVHLKDHIAIMEMHNCTLSFSGHGHPEGCLIGTANKITNLGFGTYDLKNEPQWIVAPGVARTSRKNGVLILDTVKRQIKTIPLSRNNHFSHSPIWNLI